MVPDMSRPKLSESQKFLSVFSRLSTRDPNACWIWKGGKKQSKRNGAWYGFLEWGNKVYYAHRWFFEWFVGPIPEGYEVDHRCFVTLCRECERLRQRKVA